MKSDLGVAWLFLERLGGNAEHIIYERVCHKSMTILIYVFLEQRKDFFLYFWRNEDGSKLGTEIGGLLKYEVRCQK